MSTECVLNTLIPFATRSADDGLLHVRAWRTDHGPMVLVAELDWPILLPEPRDGYSGPGIFTYPHYALPAARDACRAVGIDAADMLVRLPSPPAERYARVTDPDDPQGWTPVSWDEIDAAVGGCAWPGPATGSYTARTVEEWIAAGGPPLR